ncbi:CHASE domain-containing protein [Blastopirellula sp. JC732]|uniref:histidine kinase n=1 Tax=Blastopirellula sediminis TaxID=2894196 RepID=A0A9X1MQL6_9BACT|nr:CHASE domain-containing protein [Blastopirellula sediminis]MCC9605769.1 CHASE domain-containing protein [Blastopirellula sediminis]MCC9630931.1 CHASE domain-containing protein [Blastopirellula sediminis]
MPNEPSQPSERRASSTIDAAWLIIAARVLLCLSLGVSLMVLAAWPAGWESLRSIIDGLPTMKVNTAIGLALLAFAGLLRTQAISSQSKLHYFPKFVALLAIVLGIASLVQDVTAIDLGIATLLCDDPASVAAGKTPGLMSPGSALGIILLGFGLVFWRGPVKRLGMAGTIGGGVIGVVGIALFLSRATVLRDLHLYSTTAIHTAMLLAAISVGVLLTRRGLNLALTVEDPMLLKKELRRARPLAGLVCITLAVGLLVTIFLVRDSQRHIHYANYTSFLRRSELLSDEIQRRSNLCIYGLKGARGMYTGSERVERNEFKAYVQSRDLPAEFPGAIGFGMIKRVPRIEIDQFVALERADNAPDFAVHSLGDEPVAYIIQHIYPLDANRRAWGFDVGSENVRRTAIEKAIRSGEPTITGMIHLLQDDVIRAGFLYYVPVYKNGTNPQTPEQRETDLAGVLYAPIILERSLDHMGDLVDAGLDFEIFDGDEQSQRTHLYDHDDHLTNSTELDFDEEAYAGRLFSHSTSIMVGGRKWTITTSTLPPFEAEIDRVTPAFFGIGGAALSLLLAGIVWAMGLSQSRALTLAEDMTHELRVSEQMATHAAEEAERLAKIVRRTNNAVIITDVSGKIEWVNDGFTRLSGYSLQESFGKRPSELLYGPNSNPEAIERLSDALRLRASTNAEIVNYAKDGREYVVATEIAPLTDSSGTLTGFMLIESDITEKCAAETRLKSLNSELTMAHQEAERASKIKSEFLANMSHEIRTPMTAIIGFSDMLLEEDVPDAEKRKAVSTIQRNGNHLLELINDILDLSKVEAGKFDIELRAMDPAETLRDIQELMSDRARSQENELVFERLGKLPQTIRCDSTRLKQALLNLVGNAIKFTKKGVVKVTAQCDFEREQLIFKVIDSGIGMSPEQLQHVFQPFRQADTSTTRKFGGTGLGLTITKRIAELLGGDITVESELGRGSTFTLGVATGDISQVSVSAPLETQDASKPQVTAAASIKLSGRILLVEDGPDNRKLISFILNKAGADVTIAENGKLGLDAALEAWQAGSPYDVILMDMQMPVMDGYTAAGRLRNAGYVGQIIALTAHAMRGDINKCLDAGCDAYLTKPIERKSFLIEIASRIQMTAMQTQAVKS